MYTRQCAPPQHNLRSFAQLQAENKQLRDHVMFLERASVSAKEANRALMNDTKKRIEINKRLQRDYNLLLLMLDDLVDQAPNIMAMRIEEWNKENKMPDNVMAITRKPRYFKPICASPTAFLATSSEDTAHFVNKLAEFQIKN